MATKLALTVLGLILATLVRRVLDRGVYGVPFLTFFPVILLAALALGSRYAVLAAVGAVVLARLMLEPGRALLDQAGFTVFAVQGVKDLDGYGIVTVNGTSFSVSEQWFASEFLPDPELLPAEREPSAPLAAHVPYRACVGGASCLDSDMVTWRKVAFPRRPEIGDLLLYPNTAGYQMDSNESPFHELPLPPKLVVTLDGARPHWRVDRLSTLSGA